MKIYTKTGDQGKTGLVGGQRVSKSSLRLECYGTVDELNSALGMVLSELDAKTKKELEPVLTTIQNELFQVGSLLACEDEKTAKKLKQIEESQITRLEKQIDQWTDSLPPLRNFILPGGSRVAAYLHWSRTVCRRAERWCVRLHDESPLNPLLIQYLNRLSDHLFVAARYANHLEGISETIWKNPS